MNDSDPLLRIINLSKHFSGLTALEHFSLDIWPGEVVGMVGSSGSGKSVLVKLIAGLYSPSAGDFYFDGRRYSALRPRLTHNLGIEVIHQKPELVEERDITENIFLGQELTSGLLGWDVRLADLSKMDVEAARILDDLGMSFDSLREKVVNLSSEDRQLVAIAHALVGPVRLMVMDELLVGLRPAFQKKILALIQGWRQQGVAVLVCSNNLGALFAVTDRLVVLNKGRKVAERRTDEATQEEIVALLVGTPPPEQVTPIIWALDSYYQARQQAEELKQTQALLQQDLAAQDDLNRQLLGLLNEQVNALDSANAALQDAQRRLLVEREEERKRLARELHDQVIQDLLSYNYQLEDAEGGVSDGDQQLQLAQIRNGIRRVVSSLRQLCSDLRPPTIDHHGLSAAIRSLASQWSEQTGISIDLAIDPALGRLPEPLELSVFRIIQEGLSNVRKHANATQVELALQRTHTGSLVVRLADNGQGMVEPMDLAALAREKHFGLVGISERVSLLGGSLQVKSPPAGGLELDVEIPSSYPVIAP